MKIKSCNVKKSKTTGKKETRNKRRLNSVQWCPLWRPPLYCSRSLYTNQVIEHLYFGRCASISKRIPSMQFDCSNRINAGWIYLLQVPLSLQMLLWKFKSWLTTYAYSGTSVIRHLSFPTSCDFRQECQVPKYFFNILCLKTLSIPQPVTSDIRHCFTVPVLLITLNKSCPIWPFDLLINKLSSFHVYH